MSLGASKVRAPGAFCVVLALLLATAAGADPAQSRPEGSEARRPPPSLEDVPGILAEVQVPGGSLVAGTNVHMHAVISSWSPEALGAHFANRFLDAGFVVMPPRKRRHALEPQIVALDLATRTAHTVTLLRNRDRTTAVIRARAAAAPPQVEAGSIPLPPTALRPWMTRMEIGTQTVTFETPDTEQQVLDFYRSTLAKRGYREAEPRRFVAPTGELVLFTSEAPAQGALLVTVLERSAPPEPPSTPLPQQESPSGR